MLRADLPPAPPARRARGLRTWPALTLAALLAWGAGPARGEGPEAPWAKDVEALTEGVKEIAAPGTPGTVAVWGDAAFPVVLGKTGRLEHAPVVAAARWGKGRVVAFGHTGFGVAEALAVGQTQELLLQAARWAGHTPTGAVRIGVVGASWAKAPAGQVRALDAHWRDDLSDIDVLVALGQDLDAEQAKVLVRWLPSGGGLVVGQTGWGWKQITHADDMRTNPWNRLLVPAGLGFTDATAERTGARGFAVLDAPGPEFHAQRAFDLLLGPTRGAGAASPAQLRQASANAMAAWALLPPEGTRLRTELLALLGRRVQDLVPTPEKPLRPDRPLERFLVAVQSRALAETAPREVRAHAAAAAFPGAVASGAKAERADLVIDLGVPGWHSTGRYAVAGEPVRAYLGALKGTGEAPRLEVQIGCHTDALWHLDSWPRVPEIVRRVALGEGETLLASAFGGLVYVVVGEARPGASLEVRLEGTVAAPLYVRGVTSAKAWAASRRAPAPWGELQTSKVVFSVPSGVLRELVDPEPLLAFWDRVLDGAADLAARPRQRERPERYVADVEISAGYMHSGYPIMTHLDAAERMVDVKVLATKGDWGLFHELGHNHQEPEWTFEGTVEVTCNLFSLYLQDRLTKTPGLKAHEALAEREKRTREHLAKGAPFAAWQQDPFLALEMYIQLQEAFGWEPFTAVFAEYRGLDDLLRPKAEDTKRDQWMVRFGKRVKRDLGPFFQAWGVPVSENAREALKGLPTWMPPGFPPR